MSASESASGTANKTPESTSESSPAVVVTAAAGRNFGPDLLGLATAMLAAVVLL